jgi:predicted RecB family nuclease
VAVAYRHLMQLRDGSLQVSASDLSNFLACRHRTALDMAVATEQRARPPESEDPLLQLLWDRGMAHEKAYVTWLASQGLAVADLSAIDSLNEQDTLVAATVAAMRDGADVIVQGGLRDGRWFGKPDILRRVNTASELGAWSYEVYDTKLSRTPKAGAVLQLGLYSDLVAAVQGTVPERFFLVTPRVAQGKVAPKEASRDQDCPETMMVLAFRVNHYAAYIRLVRQQVNETAGRDPVVFAQENYPDPVAHCQICRWAATCDAKRHADDHISLVAGISRTQRRELGAQGITTLAQCAATWPLPLKPSRGSIDTYESAHLQARLQAESARQGKLLYEVRPIVSAKPATKTDPATKDEGLCRLPAPSPGDVFLDLEGDPYAVDGGREYLFGLVTAEGGAPRFEAFWGLTAEEERRSFERVMDLIAERRVRHPGMHVYHYAPYEPTAFKKLRLRYETRADSLDAMLRAGTFVDLYAVVRQGVRVGSESYSIKRLEPLYGFERSVDLEEATVCRMAIEVALQSGDPPAADIVETVRGYNEDDCVSTLWLRDWLERVRAECESRGTPVPRPTVVPEKPEQLNEHDLRVRELRPRLLQGIPDDPAQRSPEQQARWLLAHMLDYHRREALASFWEYYRLRDLPEEDLEDEPQAITGLQFVTRVGENKDKRTGKLTGVVTDRYTYPPQEMEIEKGDLNLREGGTFGTVVKVDRLNSTIDVEKRKKHINYNPDTVFAYTHVACNAQEDALYGIGSRVAEDGVVSDAPGVRDRVGRSLLLATAPRLTRGMLGKPHGEIAEFLARVVSWLDHSVLPVQGPPGSGKTYAGADAICEVVKQGRKVGISATSHQVIRNLLDAVAQAAHRRHETVLVGHKCDEDEALDSEFETPTFKSNPAVVDALNDGSAQVVGGTAWLWSHADLVGAVDVLFVDEAGQMALPNVLAMSPSAGSIVLLGDPQQLAQPKKAAHPDGVDVSALEHMLAGRATVPEDRGVFLPRTWRMCPTITKFTSETFYEGRLSSEAGLERQVVSGVGELDGAGLRLVFADHDGNRSYSSEEVAIVTDLVKRLTSDGAAWTDKAGITKPLMGSDILIVAPYNAQVSRLVAALKATGARAGTVDKFQGKGAPVVIFSMATSRPEDAPRGMEFLYSLNRLNVATSRARCLAIVVASQWLFEPECRTPRQMELANALCQYREMAR